MKHLLMTIPSERKKSYPILFGSAVPLLFSFLAKQNFSTLVVITDHTVRRLYGVAITRKLRTMNHRAHLFSFPNGEKSKTADVKNILDLALLKNNCGRNTLIVALGGGVTGDMAGFVASTYLRGVPYIQIPTTLLAMVDSSIGGKTGVDTPYGKNMIGTFWQPSAVIIDHSFLATLPAKHLQNGLYEAIKMHLVCDKKMAPLIDRFLMKKRGAIIPLITAALTHKANIVERDEKESGERMILNFGHTIGHAVEKISDYTILHGIAIGYGMLVESHISHELGILSSSTLASITQLLNAAGIHQKALRKWNARAIIAATKHDKKRRDNQPLYVLLKDIGHVYRKGDAWAHPVSDAQVSSVIMKLTTIR